MMKRVMPIVWFGPMLALGAACGAGEAPRGVDFGVGGAAPAGRLRQSTLRVQAEVGRGLWVEVGVGAERIFVEARQVPAARAPDAGRAGRDHDLAIRIANAAGETLTSRAEGELPADWRRGAGVLPSRRALRGVQRALEGRLWPDGFSEEGALVLAAVAGALGAHDVAREVNGGLELAEPPVRLPALALTAAGAGEEEHLQQIWLFAGPTGLRGLEHSATHAIVLVRPRHSGGLWYPQAQAIACNHGRCPDDASMAQYAACLDTPTVYAGSTLGAHCPGPWGLTHLCHDDTALQIGHAYGRDLAASCRGPRRFTRPTCAVGSRP